MGFNSEKIIKSQMMVTLFQNCSMEAGIIHSFHCYKSTKLNNTKNILATDPAENISSINDLAERQK